MKKKFVVYVFSLNDSAREEEFEDLENVELKPILSVILIYCYTATLKQWTSCECRDYITLRENRCKKKAV